MTKFFYFIGDLFEALFSILPPIGGITNVLFILVTTIATVLWIRYMYKVSDKRTNIHNH